ERQRPAPRAPARHREAHLLRQRPVVQALRAGAGSKGEPRYHQGQRLRRNEGALRRIREDHQGGRALRVRGRLPERSLPKEAGGELTMRVVPVPCLTDNYAYLVIAAGGAAAVVDASEAAPVRDALRREGATLSAIWSTHHHWDHVGGNEELAREAGIEVVGHVSDRGRLPALTRAVDTGDTVGVGDVSA